MGGSANCPEGSGDRRASQVPPRLPRAEWPRRPEAAALWSAMCLGWFFMFRASEYLPPQDLGCTPSRVLRGISLRVKGVLFGIYYYRSAAS